MEDSKTNFWTYLEQYATHIGADIRTICAFRQRIHVIRYIKGRTGPHHDLRNYAIEKEPEGEPELRFNSTQDGWTIGAGVDSVALNPEGFVVFT